MGVNQEKLKSLSKKKTFVFYITCLSMYILINIILGKTQEWKERPVTMILFVLCYVSLVFGVTVASLFQNQLPEIMFLLPLDKTERKKYVIVSYWIRVLLGLIPLCMVHFILVAIKEMHIIQALNAIWVGFLMLAEWNLDLEWVDSSIIYRFGKRGLSGYGIWNAIAEGINLVGYLFLHILDGAYSLDGFIIMFGMLLPTLSGISIFYYWKPVMELAQNFEVIQLAESTSNRKRKWKTYVG